MVIFFNNGSVVNLPTDPRVAGFKEEPEGPTRSKPFVWCIHICTHVLNVCFNMCTSWIESCSFVSLYKSYITCVTDSIIILLCPSSGCKRSSCQILTKSFQIVYRCLVYPSHSCLIFIFWVGVQIDYLCHESYDILQVCVNTSNFIVTIQCV